MSQKDFDASIITSSSNFYISLGSCAELETQTIIAEELGYIDKGKTSKLFEDLDHICRMTSNLLKTL